MYYERVLSAEEALYVNRAQQKIAALGAKLADQMERNDVDEYNAELMLELEYSINVLKSTDLDEQWSADDIRMMMDYYTLRGNLLVLAFQSMVFAPSNTIDSNEIWATVPQLEAVEAASQAYDAYLLSLINQLVIDYQAADNVLLNLINQISTGSGVLAAELISQVAIGGIYEGQVFPAGTSLETIWIALLGPAVQVENLSNNVAAPAIEIGTTLAVTSFTWDNNGATPVNMTLSDSAGVLTNVAVAGSSYNPPSTLNYPVTAGTPITWTLSADNMADVTFTLNPVYPSYYGKNTTANDNLVTVTEAMVLAGTKYVLPTVDEVTVTADTGNSEQGFVAVPKAQTVTPYDLWWVNWTNFSDIIAGEFIVAPVDLVVNGITYSIYRWGYRSPLTDELTLKRNE